MNDKGRQEATAAGAEALPPLLVPPPDRKARHIRDADSASEKRRRPWLVSFVSSRRLHSVLIIAALVYLFIWIPHFLWEITPEIPLKVMVVDKTVPFADYREHAGLFWLMRHNKITDPEKTDDNRFYDEATDYLGFYPPPDEDILAAEDEENALFSLEFDPNFVGPLRGEPVEKQVHWRYDYIEDSDLAGRDLLYLCDNYGVYSADYWQFKGQVAHTIHSPQIYGGLEPSELDAIESFVNEGGKTIISEFNTLASPNDEVLRDRLENIFGVDWSYWIGRYFVDFGDETDVPWWIFDLYKENYGRDWDLSGPGYLLCRDEGTDFFVLTAEEDLAPGGMMFVPRKDYAELDVMQGCQPSTFTYWFDVVTVRPDPEVEILADYEFKLTDSGKQKMLEHGLPLVLPAVVRKRVHYTSYYMAGEMTEFGKAMGPPDTRLTLHINRSFYGNEVQGSTGFPFWHTSYPMVTNILRREADFRQPLDVPVYPFR
ncbi:MAG: hypothetical protein R3F46_01915 [bacterium]